MPNNFKLTGDYYVSKFGNDSWDGLTKDTPKRTVQAGLNLMTTSNKTLIIGSGVYRETILRIFNSAPNTIKGDGKVVCEGNGSNVFYLLVGAAGGATSIDNIEFRNYKAYESPDNSNSLNITNCVFKCDAFFTGNNSSHSNNVFINSNIFTSRASSFLRCIFINCSITQTGISPSNFTYSLATSTLLDSILVNSIVRMSPTVTSFNFNNFLSSSIIMQQATAVTSGIYQDYYGNYYDLSIATSTGTGTVSDPFGRPITNTRAFGFTNHRILYPTLNPSSSAVNPKFNSIENYDLSLASDSPMIGRASDGSNIGAARYAVRNPAASSAFSGSSATVDAGLGFRYTNYVISGSAVTGSVTSAPILVNNLEKKVLQKVTYNGLLAFNKDTGSVSGSNVNVPDVETFTSASGNAGANPDRLVYYMRFTSGSAMPTTDAEWENAGLWTAGTYNVFEWNTKPSIDLSGRGNGSSSFNPADTQTFIQAQWIQLQIKLRNDYLL